MDSPQQILSWPSTPYLLPQPRFITYQEGFVPYDQGITTPLVEIDPTISPQGYELAIRPGGAAPISIKAGDEAGVFYAKATLSQLSRLSQPPDLLGACTVRDWPDFPIRGVMLDISRDKLPTLDTLKELIDRLASWKINQIQLYMEHTFRYRAHREVWETSGAFSAEEIEELNKWCSARFVELTPNQNCLGHMERWLKHDRYRHLAAKPEGFVNAIGLSEPPMTLDPSNPGSAELVKDILSQLLESNCFSSNRVHIGLDEPFELTPDRLDDYIEWINKLSQLDQLKNREVLIWGDALRMKPNLIENLPKNITVCEWGYEATYPFDATTAVLEKAGRNFWVCPGTSSWLSILGRIQNAMVNTEQAAIAGLKHGGSGYLITDWGDMGHLQYPVISEPGFALGAAFSWCHESNSPMDQTKLARLLNLHAFFDNPSSHIARQSSYANCETPHLGCADNTTPDTFASHYGIGEALICLGQAYQALPIQFPNMATLVIHLYFPQTKIGTGFTQGANSDHYRTAKESIVRAKQILRQANPQRNDKQLLKEELENAINLVELLCDDALARLGETGTAENPDGSLSRVSEEIRQRFAIRLDRIISDYKRHWLARNNEAGLADSLKWLQNLKEAYQTGECEPTWGGMPG